MITFNPAQLTKGARGTFQKALILSPPNWVDRVTTVVDSDSDKEDYSWIGEAKQMEEFEDEIKFQPLSDNSHTITNRKYMAGLSVKRDDLNDDRVGGLGMRITEMAMVANTLPNKLITDALTVGDTSEDYLHGESGVAFFANNHPAQDDEGGTQSNLLTGTGTTTSQVLTDVLSSITKLIGFLGENGEPINEMAKDFFVMYPLGIMGSMIEALDATIISNTSNVRLADFNIDRIPNPRLDATSVNDFYVGIQSAMIKGLVFQLREPTTLEVQDNAENDAAFVREEYRYKTRGRMRVGFARWNKLVKLNNS